MAGGVNQSDLDDEPISAINVTPLVDVVLVLLIIFMITAPAIYQSAIKVQLPKAKSGQEAEKTPYQFTITKSGELLWDKEKMDWQVLARRLVDLGVHAQDQTAVISADEATPHGDVIKLMDMLRQAGLTRFALNVESGAK